MILKAKAVKAIAKELQKQISSDAITVLDHHIDKVIREILTKQQGKRIMVETIQL